MAELRHLRTPWDVDRRIVLDSEEKLVIVRFSSYESAPDDALFYGSNNSDGPASKKLRTEAGAAPSTTSASPVVSGMEHYLRTQQMDALLVQMAPKLRKYAVIYAVDTNQVPQFNGMYELGHDRDPFAVMFFYRGQHIRVDVGTGNNNKVNFFAFEDWEVDFLPIVDAAYRAGKLGRNMASSEKKFSTVSLRR